MKENEYLTIEQSAQLLQISRESLYKYAQQGRIPAAKIGRHWRFDRKAIEAWMREPRGTGVGQPVELVSGKAARLSILIVEDEPVIRKLMGAWVRQSGHDVVLAAQGSDALQAIGAGAFDLILLDLHLPDMSGAEVLENLPKENRPSVVLITGLPESPVMDAALSHSILYALAKPFEKEQIEEVLAMVQKKKSAA